MNRGLFPHIVLGLQFLAVFLFAGAPLRASSAAPPQAASNGQNLDVALAGMDRAAPRFASVAADLEYTKVTVIVDDHSTERGKIYFEKSKNKLQVMLAFTQPAEKYVLLKDDKVDIYQPKIAEIDEYTLGNSQGLMEQFLLLGFGTSGTELQKSYRVSWQGEEDLDGERAIHLALTPKSAQVAARLASVDLWLSPKTWQPVQQKFTEPSKDYLIARYTNVQENSKIPSKNFALPVHGKVRTVHPQAP